MTERSSPRLAEPPPRSRLAQVVRSELSGELPSALHAAGRDRLLEALAAGPGVAAPSARPSWTSPLRGSRWVGPLLAAAGVVLAFVSGYSFGTQQTEVVLVGAESGAAVSSAAGLAATATAPADSAAVPATTAPAVASSLAPPPQPSLRQLLERGEAAKVIERVERMGVSTCLSTCSAADLEALADAARYTGRGDLAARVLPVQRQRFPGTDAAATAAFLLGRSAQGAGSDAEASRWYATYLRERPGGALAGEAQGRSMQLAHRSGDASRARALAESYLRSAPTGTYAKEAREILSER